LKEKATKMQTNNRQQPRINQRIKDESLLLRKSRFEGNLNVATQADIDSVFLCKRSNTKQWRNIISVYSRAFAVSFSRHLAYQ